MMRPLPWALAAALLAGLFAAEPAAGDQNDPILEKLFDALVFTTDRGDARAIDAEIIAVWSDAGNGEANGLLRQGTSAMNRGAFRTSLRALTELVETAPEFAEGWNRRATLYFKMQLYDDSIADVERVLALEPNHFGAWSVLGDAHFRQGNIEEASAAFREAVITNPHLFRERTMFLC